MKDNELNDLEVALDMYKTGMSKAKNKYVTAKNLAESLASFKEVYEAVFGAVYDKKTINLDDDGDFNEFAKALLELELKDFTTVIEDVFQIEDHKEAEIVAKPFYERYDKS